jgi:hypothetical protein
MRSLRLVGPVALVLVLGASVGHAVTKCSVKMDAKTGIIQVSATGVVGGVLLWDTGSLPQPREFFDAATCITGDTAKKCTLGGPGTVESITPPELCTLYLYDFGVGSCAAHIKGCTPGKRTTTPEPPPGRQLSDFVSFCDLASGTCTGDFTRVRDLDNGVSIYGRCLSDGLTVSIAPTPVNGCGPTGSDPCNFWLWTLGVAVRTEAGFPSQTTTFNGVTAGINVDASPTGFAAFSGTVATTAAPSFGSFPQGPGGRLGRLDVQAFGRGPGFSCQVVGMYIPASF